MHAGSRLIAMIRVPTARLELIAGTLEMVRAEIQDRDRLGNLLQAVVPPDWPPELDDLKMKELTAGWFEENPDGEGWLCWYFVLQNDGEGNRILIGIGGFRDKPDADGKIEIGYSVLKRFRNSGYATEAVRGLVAWAFAQPVVLRVVAETPHGLISSIRVLEKSGFMRSGQATKSKSLWFELTRESFLHRSFVSTRSES